MRVDSRDVLINASIQRIDALMIELREEIKHLKTRMREPVTYVSVSTKWNRTVADVFKNGHRLTAEDLIEMHKRFSLGHSNRRIATDMSVALNTVCKRKIEWKTKNEQA